MQKYEYVVVHKTQVAANTINEYAANGWELINVVFEDNNYKYAYIFKREIVQTPVEPDDTAI